MEGERHSPQSRQDEARNDSQAQLTGATVLFSIILSFQFSVAFERVTPVQKATYFVALVTAALTLVLLIAPTVYGRFLQESDPAAAVAASNRVLATGTVTFGLTIVATVVLVTDRLLPGIFVALLAGSIALVLVVLWLVVPWRVRRRAGS
jgi:hypothetical protein